MAYPPPATSSGRFARATVGASPTEHGIQHAAEVATPGPVGAGGGRVRRAGRGGRQRIPAATRAPARGDARAAQPAAFAGSHGDPRIAGAAVAVPAGRARG